MLGQVGLSKSGLTAAVKSDVDTTAVGTDADTVEKDLITFSLPADSLNANGKGVRVTAWGTTAANGNTKTMRLKFGATVLRAVGPFAPNNLDWLVQSIVIRTGASAQDAMTHEMVQNSVVFTSHTEPAEDTTAAITIKITGENAVAAANDIVAEGLLIERLG